MVDLDSRSQLANMLLQLINGEIATDEYYSSSTKFRYSLDLGVTEILRFSLTLFSDLYPQRSKLIFSIRDPDVINMVNRALLFLNTNKEYEWPKLPDFTYSKWLFLSGWMLLASSLVASWASQSVWLSVALWTGGLITSVATWVYQSIRYKQILIWYWSNGEKGAWPFIRHLDLLAATEQSLSV
jgi:hypothetical protein